MHNVACAEWWRLPCIWVFVAVIVATADVGNENRKYTELALWAISFLP